MDKKAKIAVTAINLLLFLGWTAGLGATIFEWSWLSDRHLAGSVVLGLLLTGGGFIGMTRQVKYEITGPASPRRILSAYMRSGAPLIFFMAIFSGLVGVLTYAVWEWVEPAVGRTLSYVLYIVVFLTLVRGLIAAFQAWTDRPQDMSDGSSGRS